MFRAAEAALAAAVAEVGVAEADFYPSLTIPGVLTFGVTGFGTGSAVETMVASLASALDIPLFDSGAREARLAAAKARAREALLVYRQQLLEAVAEVETALGELASAEARRDDLAEAVAASEIALRQARDLYAQGLTGFLDVLDAERTLLDNRQDLAEARADVALLIADLYTALGAPFTCREAPVPVPRCMDEGVMARPRPEEGAAYRRRPASRGETVSWRRPVRSGERRSVGAAA